MAKVIVKIKTDSSDSDKKDKKVEISLDMRKTLDGDIMVFDHDDLDIVIMPNKNKIVAFAKDKMGEEVYEAQEKMFKYLAKRGIIDYGSVQGGNVFMSLEAKLHDTNEYDTPLVALYNISKFLDEEMPTQIMMKHYEEEEERRLLDPDPADSTEFDPEKHHNAQKGSLRPNMRPYGIGGIYRI